MNSAAAHADTGLDTSTTKKVVLHLRNIDRSFESTGKDRVPILAGVDLTITAGSTTSIMGRSGSGKSTLLSIMGLLGHPDTGQVSVAGVNTGDLNDARRTRLRNRAIGFVFQNYSLMPTWTVRQNCQLPMLYGARQRRGADGAATRQLIRLGLGDKLDVLPAVLSGGEQQRAAIARALVHEPAIVLADEPTGALDEDTADSVLKILLEATHTAGCALVIVTHDAQVAARADTRYVLRGGALHVTTP